VAQPFVGEEEVKAAREVILSGKYISGEKVKEFEDKFADFIGTKHAVAVNSGTAALHLSLSAFGIGPGDEVIVPPLTFFSTVSSILHQNAIPVFADIDMDNYCLDPEDMKRKITRRTKAVIPVHLYGNSADMSKIINFSKTKGIKVIEDCAQAHGTEFNRQKVGSLGDTGCFSFFATKNMTTGEGGMITTNDKEIAQRCRLIRNHGMSSRDDHILLGYNYRMNEIAAAIGIVQLNRLDQLNQIRICNSKYLIENLKNINWIKVPKLSKNVKHTFFWCPIFIDEEKLNLSVKELISYLKDKNIEVRHRYWKPLYKQKLFIDKSTYPKECPFNCMHSVKRIDYSKIYLSNAEKISGKLIGLPNHPKLSKNDLKYIIKTLKEIKGSHP
jgi:perosamine synthetase